MCPNSTYWEADLIIDQTLPLTVENIPLKKKVFSGFGFELDGGREIREWLNLPIQELPKIILFYRSKGKIARVRVSFF
jgi:hypothetical protein